ncbi:unnamed protein product [Spodoptera exigua]|nr:unnamed protein product [Spodoptera exigua]
MGANYLMVSNLCRPGASITAEVTRAFIEILTEDWIPVELASSKQALQRHDFIEIQMKEVEWRNVVVTTLFLLLLRAKPCCMGKVSAVKKPVYHWPGRGEGSARDHGSSRSLMSEDRGQHRGNIWGG